MSFFSIYPENCSECGVLLESAAHGCSLGNLRRVVGELQILFDVAGEIVTLVVSLPQRLETTTIEVQDRDLHITRVGF